MYDSSKLYTRLIAQYDREVLAGSATLDKAGITGHLKTKLENIEAWLGEHKDLLGDVVLQEENSTEYAYSQLGYKLALVEVLDLLGKMEESV